jgi:hypothetical protein
MDAMTDALGRLHGKDPGRGWLIYPACDAEGILVEL